VSSLDERPWYTDLRLIELSEVTGATNITDRPPESLMPNLTPAIRIMHIRWIDTLDNPHKATHFGSLGAASEEDTSFGPDHVDSIHLAT